MQRFINISAALADEGRVRALLALRRGELCMCQITELLLLAPSTVSKHLSLLKQAGLVESRKQGRWIFYRIADDENASPEAHPALQWAVAALARDPLVVEDARRLKAILREDPEQLCRRQSARKGCVSSTGMQTRCASSSAGRRR